ncbi:MAG: type II toxin-antitoxin system VapC family toxin [Verrucomicrobiaceae bacterium]|nr:type II toxin-antitoxin system VapC family toxin [Verrucomicrobiaceae bacterium]
MPSAYIETTIPSYYVARPSMNVIQAARQASTRAWWDGGCSSFDLFTSQEVLQEARLGDADMARQRLELLSPLPKLELTDQVGALAQTLIDAGLVPEKAASDAVHIAVASVHQMNYIVTWNFKHIANPYTRDRLRAVVADAGFHLPVMSSPEELIQYDEDT